MTNSIWPKKIFMILFGNGMTGLKSTYPIQMTSIEKSCKQVQRHCTLLSAGIRMRPGFRYSKRRMPKPTVITLPLKVVGLGKKIDSLDVHLFSHMAQ